MRTNRLVTLFGMAAMATLPFAAPASAQTGQTAQIPLQFDFLEPGARSLGIGSAFTAVADDATAAYTNPAGLTFLVRPEVSAEVRYRNLNTSFLSGGRLSGTPTETGIDTVGTPTYGSSIDSAVRPYFLSVVYPIGRISIAAYRHELVLQNNSFLSQGPFLVSTVDGSPLLSRFPGLTGSRDVTVDNYGGAFGLRVSSALSVGLDVSVYHFDDTSSFFNLPFNALSKFFLPADPTEAGSSSVTTQNGSSTTVGITAGALITVNPKLRLGAVWRQGTSFNFTQVNTVPGLPNTTESGTFRTPGVFGVGVRVQPNDALSISADYDRVQYSQLVNSFITLQVPPTDAGLVSINNGNEFHVGLEYTLLHVDHTPSLRAGLWFDPNHTVQYASDGTNSAIDQLLKAAFPGGSSQMHYCFGAGLPLSRAYEVNVGADFASGARYVSGSIIARFGK